MPDLHKTLQKYLKSIEPFLLEDERRGGLDFQSAYEERVKLVNDFERDIGPLCQQRLLGTRLSCMSCSHIKLSCQRWTAAHLTTG